jgi:hypothetical protein
MEQKITDCFVIRFLIPRKDNTTLELKNFTKIMTWTEILPQ